MDTQMWHASSIVRTAIRRILLLWRSPLFLPIVTHTCQCLGGHSLPLVVRCLQQHVVGRGLLTCSLSLFLYVSSSLVKIVVGVIFFFLETMRCLLSVLNDCMSFFGRLWWRIFVDVDVLHLGRSVWWLVRVQHGTTQVNAIRVEPYGWWFIRLRRWLRRVLISPEGCVNTRASDQINICSKLHSHQ